MYLNTDLSHVKNFFQNILLKTARLCDVRLQNYGGINFVQFFLDHPCIFCQAQRYSYYINYCLIIVALYMILMLYIFYMLLRLYG